MEQLKFKMTIFFKWRQYLLLIELRLDHTKRLTFGEDSGKCGIEKVGLLIDVNGYKKEERYEKLCRMAVRVAKDVRRTKIDASLDPMTADERKAVHNALADLDNISTHSEGGRSSSYQYFIYTW